MTDAWVDGNEMAGPLREVFAVDITVARGRCVGCGLEGPVAEVHVFDRAPGLVARCAGLRRSADAHSARAGPGLARPTWHDLPGAPA